MLRIPGWISVGCFVLIVLFAAIMFGFAMVLGWVMTTLSAFFSWLGWWPVIIGFMLLVGWGLFTQSGKK